MRAVTIAAAVVWGASVIAVTGTAAVATGGRQRAEKKEQERGGTLSWVVVESVVSGAVAICDTVNRGDEKAAERFIVNKKKGELPNHPIWETAVPIGL